MFCSDEEHDCDSDEEHVCDSDSDSSTDSVSSCVSDPSYTPENASISSASDGDSETDNFDSDELSQKNLLPDGYAARILDNMTQLSTQHKSVHKSVNVRFSIMGRYQVFVPDQSKVCNSPLKEKVHVSNSVTNLSVELIVQKKIF